jgi:cell division protein FtsL
MYTLLLTVAVVFLLNVWQSYRYTQLERDVAGIQREHRALLEENKRLVVGIASLRSPQRIRAIARDDLNMEPAPASRIRRIDFPQGNVSGF